METVLPGAAQAALAQPQPDVLPAARGESKFASRQPGWFTSTVQFELSLPAADRQKPGCSSTAQISADLVNVPVMFQRNSRARRYVLRLRPDGTARVTIPRGGSAAAARDFVLRHVAWLERQLQRLASQPRHATGWHTGSKVLFRGEPVCIEVAGPGEPGRIRFGSETLSVPDAAADLRPLIERHLRNLAGRELPPRLLAYASVHGLPVRRVTVRNQRTRWGSCSIRGTISLNWRLIQTPPFVRDYICLHELMHLRQMNHSPRFWREVESVCPYYPIAERWLKAHSRLLH